MTPEQIQDLLNKINQVVAMLVADVYGQGTAAYNQAMTQYQNFCNAVKANPQANAQLDEALANSDSMENE
jgi:hypothetical protein